MIKEIGLTKNFIPDKNIDTIYFGGGTPSLLPAAEIIRMILEINKNFEISKNAEITLEANPDDISAAKLHEWKHAGINRLSVGLQSFNDEELRWMNRAHNSSDSRQCINEILDAGFTNFSIDLIYGSPLLTNEMFFENVQYVINMGVPHISCYALTVEPKTALYNDIRKKVLPGIDPEKQSEQFILLMNWMRDAGYEHYEISNFCKPGMRSRHNSSYWRGVPYHGIGPSAHSFDGKNKRRWNVANNALYIKSIEKDVIPFTEEVLTKVQQVNEMIMIALRTTEGINVERIEKEFNSVYASTLVDNIAGFVENGKLIYGNGFIRLTDEGKLYADGIASDLFFSE